MPNNQMLINYVPGQECRIAIVVGEKLEELYQERASVESHVGNIYKARVMNVEPAIQAAFVDFGLERNGFLHITDLHPMYFNRAAREQTERVGLKTPRRERPLIQKCLRRGDDMLIQVLKEGIGTKGPTVTSYLSIPGRFLVMMPNMSRLGVSRKVEDLEERREMRRILDELDPPKEFGFILRTAGFGRTKIELKRDLAYLQRLWKTIEQRRAQTRAIGELYAESDLIIRTIRDVFSSDIDQVIVDHEDAAHRVLDFLSIASPRSTSKVLFYNDTVPLFHRYGIEAQIDQINAREVELPSGGSLVIEQTEAMVTIDVNSGRMRSNRDAETTAFRTNVEAVDEICRQLRLRDLGGVIAMDLIDMLGTSNRRSIEGRVRDNLKDDRARTRVGFISQFGVLEMTRQRMRPSLKTAMYAPCEACAGSGQIKSAESIALDMLRRMTMVLHHKQVSRVELFISRDVAFVLLNSKRSLLTDIERRIGKSITVRISSDGPMDTMEMSAFDERESVIDLDSLRNRQKPVLEPVIGSSRSGQHPGDTDDEPIDDADGEPTVEHADTDAHDETAPGANEADATGTDARTHDDESESKPRRRRRRRGGRRRRSRTDADTASQDVNGDTGVDSNTDEDTGAVQADADTKSDDSAKPQAASTKDTSTDAEPAATETPDEQVEDGATKKKTTRRRSRGTRGGTRQQRTKKAGTTRELPHDP